MFPLAYADAPDNSNAALLMMLLALGIIAVAALAAAVPAIMARRRRHRAAGALGLLSFLWALAAGGLGLFSLIAWEQWSKENLIREQSGYYDPRTGAPPSLHPLGWLIVAIAYIALVAVSSARSPSAGPPSDD